MHKSNVRELMKHFIINLPVSKTPFWSGDVGTLSRIYKMKQDLQDVQDCQDEEEKRLTCHNRCLFILLIL